MTRKSRYRKAIEEKSLKQTFVNSSKLNTWEGYKKTNNNNIPVEDNTTNDAGFLSTMLSFITSFFT